MTLSHAMIVDIDEYSVEQEASTSECKFVATQYPPYERPVVIHHWQLRDLVQASSSEEIYVAGETSTIYYNTSRRVSRTAQQLGFSPYALAYGYGYLAAGGPHFSIQVTDVANSSTLWRGQVDGSLLMATNNALHIAKTSAGDCELFVCNNDSTIKVFRLGANTITPMARVAIIRCGSPPNYAALSANGEHLACVTDSEHTVVYQPTPSGYVETHRWVEACDAGMCCSWAPGSGCIASAHQDGTVCVWDVRSNSVIQKYKLAGAARNVKFCPSSACDLMALAEHEDFVHLVDTRRWDRLQHLAVTGDSTNDIAGLSFDPAGTRLFVALDERVVAFEVDTALRHAFPSGALV